VVRRSGEEEWGRHLRYISSDELLHLVFIIDDQGTEEAGPVGKEFEAHDLE
jgi:hypothetical protein